MARQKAAVAAMLGRYLYTKYTLHGLGLGDAMRCAVSFGCLRHTQIFANNVFGANLPPFFLKYLLTFT